MHSGLWHEAMLVLAFILVSGMEMRCFALFDYAVDIQLLRCRILDLPISVSCSICTTSYDQLAVPRLWLCHGSAYL